MKPPDGQTIFPVALLRRRGLPAILVLAAVAQAAQMGVRTLERDQPVRQVNVGGDLSSLAIDQGLGPRTILSSGRAVLILAFDPDCPHSRLIAPEWSAWLSASDLEGVSVLAVSFRPLSESASYAREAGWTAQVGTVKGGRGTVGQAMAARTPWVFAVDEAGLVVAEGHGSRIREVAMAIGVGSAGG